MSFMKRKATRKQLEEKVENLIIEMQRQRRIRDEKLVKMQAAVDEIQLASDIMFGQIIEAYGTKNGDAIILNVPKSQKRYHLGCERHEDYVELNAVEIKEPKDE